MKILFLLFILQAHAEDTAYQVEVDPKVYPSAEFEGKGVKAGTIPTRVKRADALPGKTERENAFSHVSGLKTDVAKMDELDRDMLFVRARTRSLVELKKLYPNIEVSRLELLQKELRKK